MDSRSRSRRPAPWRAVALTLFLAPVAWAQSEAVDSGLVDAVDAALRETGHRAVWQVGTPFPGVKAAWQAPNHDENLRTFFLPEGVRIRPRVAGEAPWAVDLSLVSLRRGDSSRDVPGGEVVPSEGRVEIRRPGIVEWYVNDPRGLEQGFDLAERFGGRDAQLELALELGGDLSLERVEPGRMVLSRAGIEGSVSIAGLFASDATGRDLPARFERRGSEFSIVVDDRDATYPITIDPIVQTTGALHSVAFDDPDGRFGSSVEVRGDRAVIGAPGVNTVVVLDRDSFGVWTQVQRIVSLSAQPGDEFGASLALNGDFLFVGAPRQEAGGIADCGRVHVFRSNGSFYTLSEHLTAAVPQAGARFGASVSGDGFWLAVGAPLHDVGAQDSGAVVAFRRSGSQWVEHQRITVVETGGHFGTDVALRAADLIVGRPSGSGGLGDVRPYFLGTVGTFFGFQPDGTLTLGGATNLGASVDIHGDHVIAGAPGLPGEHGQVGIWVRQFHGGFALEGSVSASSGGTRLGASVGISVPPGLGRRAVVGAPQFRVNGVAKGRAVVLRQVAGNWSIDETIEIGSTGSSTGASVCIDEDAILVGGPSAPSFDEFPGRATIHNLVSFNWVFGSTETLLDLDFQDRLGEAIAIDGDLAVVGCPQDDSGAFNSGSAYLFERVGSNDWDLVSKLTAGSLGSTFARMGTSVAVEGTTIFVGAPGGRVSTGTQAGVVHRFEHAGNGTVLGPFSVEAPDPAHGDEFGSSMALDSSTLVVGAPFAFIGSVDSGATYVFGRTPGGVSAAQKLSLGGGRSGDRFGASLGVDASRLVVGAPGRDTGSLDDVGVVRAFRRQGASWVSDGDLVLQPAEEDAEFGASLALRHDRAIVGAPGRGDDRGHVSVWRDGAAWALEAELVGPTAASRYGHAVAFDGSTLVVGAPASDAVAVDHGEAFAYSSAGANWSEEPLVVTQVVVGSDVGSSVAVDGGIALVGAPGLQFTEADSGGFFSFELPAPATYTFARGDGSEGDCPCNNESAPGADRGCRNSTGLGGRLQVTGSSSVSAVDLGFVARDLPAGSFGVLVMGTTYGPELHVGNGLFRLGGTLTRHGVSQASSSGTMTFANPSLGLSSVDVGTQRLFQVWYRDVPSATCTAGFNVTVGKGLTVQP